MASSAGERPIVVHFGHDELVIRQRYEVASIVNDILIGIWFLVGSFLFLSGTTTRAGTWLFAIGSIEMLIRPLIRLTRRVHLRRIAPDREHAAAHDF
ncbi:YrhK family protein [Sciscionella marina]|uniref:YrhK family protein n=1 Tax=Sciscionella marina TaxID=508770 RepID=UPI00058D47CE|nr:YrhK family protein [Sciscionella marina]